MILHMMGYENMDDNTLTNEVITALLKVIKSDEAYNTGTLTAIPNCKYRLPCGRCELTKELCTTFNTIKL